MSKPVIAIDIDDVIASSTEALRLLVNERFNASLEPEHYRVAGEYWGYYERVWQEHGVATDIDYDAVQSEMVVDQSHVPLLPGASFAIGQLSKKYDIALVTARNFTWEKATLEWLEEHFGDVFIGVHFAGNKHRTTDKTKGELCKDVGAFLLIDDNADHCRSALAAGLDAILFGDYGWQHNKKDGLTNCIDWPEVLEYLENGQAVR